jgi:hypothetical protein
MPELDKGNEVTEEAPVFLIPYIIQERDMQKAGICDGIPAVSYHVLRAIEDGKTTGLKELIENHRQMVLYHSMMCIAAGKNNVEAIKIMLEADFSPDTRYWSSGITPLVDAVSSGSIEAAEVLLDAGADIEENNDNTSATPLLCAIRSRIRSNIEKAQQIEMVKFLLKRGAK